MIEYSSKLSAPEEIRSILREYRDGKGILMNILLVEDEKISHNIIKMTLEKSAYSVTSAFDGEQALHLLKLNNPPIDWVFTDIKLPGLVSGWIVGSQFHLSHPDRPVIYATAENLPSFRQTAGSHFLRKPFPPSKLLEILAQEIARLSCIEGEY